MESPPFANKAPYITTNSTATRNYFIREQVLGFFSKTKKERRGEHDSDLEAKQTMWLGNHPVTNNDEPDIKSGRRASFNLKVMVDVFLESDGK